MNTSNSGAKFSKNLFIQMQKFYFIIAAIKSNFKKFQFSLNERKQFPNALIQLLALNKLTAW